MAHNQGTSPQPDLPPDLPSDFAPGLQPERTSLAWNRTTLACLVNGLLLLRGAVKLNSFLFALLSTLMLCCVVFMHGYSHLRNWPQKRHGAKNTHSPHLINRIPAKIIAHMIALCSAILTLYFASQILLG